MALTVVVAVALTVLPAVAGIGPQAHAGEISGRMIFKPNDLSYALADRNGRFTAQATYTPGLPIAWSFTPGPQLRAIATSPMTCTAGHMQLRYHDRHVVPVQYTWHSTIRGHATNVEYLMYGSCKFQVNVGGKPGTAVLTIKFSYVMQ